MKVKKENLSEIYPNFLCRFDYGLHKTAFDTNLELQTLSTQILKNYAKAKQENDNLTERDKTACKQRHS